MEKLKIDFIDRALTFFNPRAAYERIAWKFGIRSYDAGSTDRINSGWTAINAPAEQMNQSRRDLLRARSRDLERNSCIAESIVGAFERNVIGTGLKLQAKPVNANEEEDDKLARQIEELFDEWCRAENCDIVGETDFNEMQAMALRRMIVDGGYLFVIVDNPYKGKFSFMLQMREVDDIDGNKFSYRTENGNRIINGVELNKFNKPVAYWLKNTSPDGLTLGESTRVSAERVIYLNKRIRPSQVREVPKLANTIDLIRDLNEFTEAISIKERVLACLAVFIRKALPGNGGPGRGSIASANVDKTSGYQTKTLAPGMISELQPGDDISTVNPSGQASNAKDFISSEQRLAASGQGLSYETVSRDMSQVNYSSARQGLIEDDKTYEMIRHYIRRKLCETVFREFVAQCVLEGKLKISDFSSNKEKYLRHSWIAPGRNWIDPLKEVNANEKALNSNQTTLAQICRASGQDWREVIKQRAAEKQFAESLGLTEGDKNVKTK